MHGYENRLTLFYTTPIGSMYGILPTFTYTIHGSYVTCCLKNMQNKTIKKGLERANVKLGHSPHMPWKSKTIKIIVPWNC